MDSTCINPPEKNPRPIATAHSVKIELASLGSAIDSLEAKLGFVLKPKLPSGDSCSDSCSSPSSNSQLINDLENLKRVVSNLTDAVESIAERVDV